MIGSEGSSGGSSFTSVMLSDMLLAYCSLILRRCVGGIDLTAQVKGDKARNAETSTNRGLTTDAGWGYD